MSDLTQKFSTFESQTAAQHTALMARLQYTNELLGQMLVALGSAPPTQTTTMADIATILMAIHADTQSQDLKLLRMRDAIAPLSEALPSGAKTSMAWSLFRLMDATAPAYDAIPRIPIQVMSQQIRDYLYEFFGSSDDATYSLLWYVSRIYSDIGIPTGDATTTALGYLAQIANQTLLAVTPPVVPPIMSVDSCTAMYSSTGLRAAVLPLGTNESTWTNPPVQLQFGDSGSASAPHNLLYPASGTTWVGWHLLVESRAPYFLRVPIDPNRYPTNTWLPVARTDNGFLDVYVDQAFAMTVHLCAPGYLLTEPAPPTTVTIAAELIATSGATLWLIPWRGLLGAQGLTHDGSGNATSAEPVWFTPAYEYTFTPNTNVDVYGGDAGGVAAGQAHVLHVGSVAIAIVGSGPFSITLARTV